MRNLFLRSVVIFGMITCSAEAQTNPSANPSGGTSPYSLPTNSSGAVDYSKIPSIVLVTGLLASMAGVMQVCHPPVASDVHKCMTTLIKNWSSLNPNETITQQNAQDLEKLWEQRFLDAYDKQKSSNPPDTCSNFTNYMEASQVWSICYGSPPDPNTGAFGDAPTTPTDQAQSPDSSDAVKIQ
jgi:hypothetical protein